jgi:hypothetical protein
MALLRQLAILLWTLVCCHVEGRLVSLQLTRAMLELEELTSWKIKVLYLIDTFTFGLQQLKNWSVY